MNWYLDVLRKYAEFSGRARRKEYWMFTLISTIISLVLGGIGAAVDFSLLSTIYGVAVLIPTLAVLVRRLHDTGRSGWWVLIGLVPLAGAIILIIFCATEGHAESNEFGKNPKTDLKYGSDELDQLTD